MTEVQTLFRVEGDRSARVNTKTRFLLYSEDERNRAKDVDINNLEAWLRGGRSNMRGRISRVSVGTYSIEFILTDDAGIHQLEVTLEGRPVFRKGDVQLDITNHDPGRTRYSFEVDGIGLHGGRVGENSEIGVTVKDDYGKPTDIDPSKLEVVLQGPSTVHAQLGYDRAGRYRATFAVGHGGDYSIIIHYDTRKVLEKQGVKFSDKTNASRSTISNAPDRVYINTEIKFTITSKDSYGQRVHMGGDHWEVVVSGPERASKLIVTDHNDGTYTVSTLLPHPALYTFDVKHLGMAAANSPIAIRAE